MLEGLIVENLKPIQFKDFVSKKGTLFECRCIKHGSANWGHYFYVSYWKWDGHFMRQMKDSPLAVQREHLHFSVILIP